MYDLVILNTEPAIRANALEWALGQKKWTAARFSQESGVSTALFSLLFQGKRTNISAANLGTIADALEISTDFVMGLTPNPYRQGGLEVNTEFAEIVAVTRALPKNRQRDLHRIAETYLQCQEEAAQELRTEIRPQFSLVTGTLMLVGPI